MNIYIIISSIGIGGAEKRFTELWLNMQLIGMNNIKLVLPKITYDKLMEVDQLKYIENYSNNIIVYDWTGGSYFAQRKTLISLVKEYDPNSIFHFIMGYPLFINFFNQYNVIYTYTSTSFKQINFKGLFVTIISFFESNKIDILDPRLTQKIKKYFFYKRNSITNTPGSFVDLSYYTPVPIEDKKNWLVFLGRFEDVKQVFEFVKSIPYIDRKLKEEGITNHKFYMLGAGSLQAKINEYIEQNSEYKDIDFEIYFEKQPLNILKYSKIFFSLQKHSNYPSKSLLEAIACGNIPIVTDNGDTKKIANPSFSYYVTENFSSEELADRCIEVLNISQGEWLDKLDIAKRHIEKNFSVMENIKYFREIYQLD